MGKMGTTKDRQKMEGERRMEENGRLVDGKMGQDKDADRGSEVWSQILGVIITELPTLRVLLATL